MSRNRQRHTCEQETIIKLSTKSLCLWALVPTSNPCFIPNLRAGVKRAKHCTISWFAGSHSDKGMKDISSSEYVGQANPKLGGETPVRPNLGEKTNLVPCFFHVYCFHPDFSFHLQFGRNCCSVAPLIPLLNINRQLFPACFFQTYVTWIVQQDWHSWSFCILWLYSMMMNHEAF